METPSWQLKYILAIYILYIEPLSLRLGNCDCDHVTFQRLSGNGLILLGITAWGHQMGICFFCFFKRVLKYIESYLLTLCHVSKNCINRLYHIMSMLMLWVYVCQCPCYSSYAIVNKYSWRSNSRSMLVQGNAAIDCWCIICCKWSHRCKTTCLLCCYY